MGGEILDSELGSQELYKKISSLEQSKQPDLIIADYNSLFIPAIETQYESPFFIEGESVYGKQIAENSAYGLGLSMMFYAFDYIKLGKIYWPKIISEGLNLELKK